ncbi:unnamed protein product, partial [Didymodactylos carnosus]
YETKLNKTSVTTDDSERRTATLNLDFSKYLKKYDIRFKMGHQGFWGFGAKTKVNVYIKVFDKNGRFSQDIQLYKSKLHHRPFISNQIDQFEVGSTAKLGPISKIELWHDGKDRERLHCHTIELTDQDNGKIYCFQIKQWLEENTRLELIDYDNKRCIDVDMEHHKSPERQSVIQRDQYEKDEQSLAFSTQKMQTELQQDTNTYSDVSTTTSNNETNQNLFKIRTRVGHKGFLRLGKHIRSC